MFTGMLLKRFAEKAKSSSGPWRSGSRIEREVEVRQDLARCAERCRAILTNIGEERRTADPASVFEVVTPQNLASNGTVIRLTLKPSGAKTLVQIETWPGAQLIDWGESKRVAFKVEREIAAAAI